MLSAVVSWMAFVAASDQAVTGEDLIESEVLGEAAEAVLQAQVGVPKAMARHAHADGGIQAVEVEFAESVVTKKCFGQAEIKRERPVQRARVAAADGGDEEGISEFPTVSQGHIAGVEGRKVGEETEGPRALTVLQDPLFAQIGVGLAVGLGSIVGESHAVGRPWAAGGGGLGQDLRLLQGGVGHRILRSQGDRVSAKTQGNKATPRCANSRVASAFTMLENTAHSSGEGDCERHSGG